MHYRSSYSRVYTCIYIYTRAFCVENGVCGELMTGIEAATFFWSSVRWFKYWTEVRWLQGKVTTVAIDWHWQSMFSLVREVKFWWGHLRRWLYGCDPRQGMNGYYGRCSIDDHWRGMHDAIYRSPGNHCLVSVREVKFWWEQIGCDSWQGMNLELIFNAYITSHNIYTHKNVLF